MSFGRRGTMSLAPGCIMVVIIGVIVLTRFWEQLPSWLLWLGSGFLALLLLMALYESLCGFKGMAHNASMQDLLDDYAERQGQNDDTEPPPAPSDQAQPRAESTGQNEPDSGNDRAG